MTAGAAAGLGRETTERGESLTADGMLAESPEGEGVNIICCGRTVDVEVAAASGDAFVAFPFEIVAGGKVTRQDASVLGFSGRGSGLRMVGIGGIVTAGVGGRLSIVGFVSGVATLGDGLS